MGIFLEEIFELIDVIFVCKFIQIIIVSDKWIHFILIIYFKKSLFHEILKRRTKAIIIPISKRYSKTMCYFFVFSAASVFLARVM